jgi:hypothetical protein
MFFLGGDEREKAKTNERRGQRIKTTPSLSAGEAPEADPPRIHASAGPQAKAKARQRPGALGGL